MKKTIRFLPLLLAIAVLALALTACGGLSDDYKNAAQKLEDAGYLVTLDEAENGEAEGGIVATLVAYKSTQNGVEALHAAYYVDEKAAAADWETYRDKIISSLDQLGELASSLDYGLNGNVIYVGTANAVRDAG